MMKKFKKHNEKRDAVEKRREKSKDFGGEFRNPKFKDQASKFSNDRKREFVKPIQSSASETYSPVIFGLSPVLEALRSGARRVEKIMMAEGAREHRLNEILDLARANNIPFQKAGREILTRFVESDANHQGVIAWKSAADYANPNDLLNEISASDDALAVILDGVEDPRNLGAILRTVECSGADGVFIPERRAVGLTEIVAKTSAGATEYVKIAKVTNVARLVDDLKSRNIWTIGTGADAKMNYTDWDWTQKCALILGGEGKGLHRLVAEKCDVLVKIPLSGQIESLNVSVAAGVILYEAVRQRNEKAKRLELEDKD